MYITITIQLYIKTDCTRGSHLVASAVLQTIRLKRVLVCVETKLSWRSVVLPSGIQDLIPSQRVGAFKALDHARDMVDFLEVGSQRGNPGALVSPVCNSVGRVQDSVVTRICQTNELVCDFTDLVTMACYVSSFPGRHTRHILCQ